MFRDLTVWITIAAAVITIGGGLGWLYRRIKALQIRRKQEREAQAKLAEDVAEMLRLLTELMAMWPTNAQPSRKAS
jgi:hypothetical protein